MNNLITYELKGVTDNKKVCGKGYLTVYYKQWRNMFYFFI